MKIFITLTFLLLFTGCNQHSVKHTSFFNTHNAVKHLGNIAAKSGYDSPGSGSGHSVGGATGEKDFQISIKGDAKLRDQLMKEYKGFIKNAIEDSGAYIRGTGQNGSISGFDFNYHKSGTTGLFRANAVVGPDGYIEFDVLIYEHRK